jgi:hypothetical protein
MVPRTLGRSLVALLAATLGVGLALPAGAQAPDGLQQDPVGQVGDLYAFVSPDKPDTVTIITTWGGAHSPADWSTEAWFDPDLQYWVKIDNDGDGAAEITWTFRVLTTLTDPNTILTTGFGQVPGVAPTIIQSMTAARDGIDTITVPVPPPNIGPRTTPGYGRLSSNYVNILDGGAAVSAAGALFAGQRDDPAFGEMGSLDDLFAIRPLGAKHAIEGKRAKALDTRAGLDTMVIAMQAPISWLTADGSVPTDPIAPGSVVGIWAGASRMTPDGSLVQVSRVGAPLVEQWLIPYGQRDAWRAGDPSGDAAFEGLYQQPQLATLLAQAYPGMQPPRATDRADLVQVLGRGIPGLTQTTTDGFFDQLRLNVAVPPTRRKPNRLGVMGGDLAGYPNGRRPADDVVDVTLRMVGDGYGASFAELLTTAGVPAVDAKANRALGDGCARNDAKALKAFPYAGVPWDGVKGGRTYRTCPAK